MTSNRNNWIHSFRPNYVFLLFLITTICWTVTKAEEDNIKSTIDRDKRAPQLYSFGLGKKSYNIPLDSDNIDEDEMVMAENGNDLKRDEHRYALELGKRYDQRFAFGLGKRDPSGRYSFGLGKREPNRFAFGLGKRSMDGDMEDYMKRRFSFGLGKRADDTFNADIDKRPDQRFSFGLGKRADHRFAFGLGKRPDQRFSFGLGRRKRSTQESNYSSEEEYKE
ncbi:allatostatins [Centruroides vittatus]|uniref:allatostatins n=1 Tax=Centruroides vittatus TaxID=120091 RepID=UPI003510B3C8